MKLRIPLRIRGLRIRIVFQTSKLKMSTKRSRCAIGNAMAWGISKCVLQKYNRRSLEDDEGSPVSKAHATKECVRKIPFNCVSRIFVFLFCWKTGSQNIKRTKNSVKEEEGEGSRFV